MNTQAPDFDSIKQVNVYGVEYWSARDLMPLLGYDKKWQNFQAVIKKAMTCCELTKQDTSLHFLRKDRAIEMPKGGYWKIIDYHLSRYALHLVFSFADIKKAEVIKAISYFTLVSLNTSINYIAIAQKLNVSIQTDVAVTKEQKTIAYIMRAFKHLNSVQQYRIDPYRIDLYFPDERIAIECDEHGHRRYPAEDEYHRQSFIEHQLRCTFIRYNPDAANFHIADVIHEIIMLIERQR